MNSNFDLINSFFIIIASNDDVIASESKSAATDDKPTCTFGSMTLKIGEELKQEDKCNKCECKIPPFITCTKTNNC